MKQHQFLQVSLLEIPDDEEIRDILMTVLLDMDFDSFWEEDDKLHGYIATEKYNSQKTSEAISAIAGDSVKIVVAALENKNWNEEWEKNFDPVDIDGQIYVYAPFHPERPEIPYKIRIVPKMSFGTAHHATTSSMLKLMLDINFENQLVIDAGTGTGILAVFAEMKGAESVFAYDNDDWSVVNSLENIERNACKKIDIVLGENDVLKGKKCDILLANIHKNVILNDLSAYASTLNKGGILLLSGFYTDDLPDISEACEKNGFEIDTFLTKENWVAARFTKIK
ncbi:MAG: 50S ribosomal protein L11 methyltransferase [Bacteroidetes bacterium HGW-Bacteroidetes-6]|jgi:ribosomal protein L11 methyltransferase|nr:MAG: 50S ribosomal protein L11 methyltransferase [Bacteroidetes bacterium HGW-Bacteroidetes-6]